MRRTRQILAALVLLGMLVVLAACGSSGTTSEGNTIVVDRLQFHPRTLTIQSGETVTIVNEDSWGEDMTEKITHHIVIGTDDLGEQASGTSRTWTAPRDGVYLMKCLIHPVLSGKITVGAGGPTFGTPSSDRGTRY